MIPIDRNPPRRTLNQFGFLWLGFFLVFGALAKWKSGNQNAAHILWALAVAVPVLGWMVPAFMRLVFLGMSYLAWPVGFVVTHVILMLVYYLVITPLGALVRLCGRDPMARRFDPAAPSYWIERPPGPVDPKRYFRQF